MKNLNLLALSGIFLATTSFAAEVRPFVGTCTSKDAAVQLSFFAHKDLLKTGLVDVLVKADLGSAFGEMKYLVSDIVSTPEPATNQTKVFFTDGDITVDVTINNGTNTGTIAVEKGKSIALKCVGVDSDSDSD
jgi:hypothetical protein